MIAPVACAAVVVTAFVVVLALCRAAKDPLDTLDGAHLCAIDDTAELRHVGRCAACNGPVLYQVGDGHARCHCGATHVPIPRADDPLEVLYAMPAHRRAA